MHIAAKTLEILPDLAKHPETSEWVHVAISAIGKTKQASILLQGMRLISTADSNANASTDATTFVKAHQADNPKIPAGFWKELQHVVEHEAVGIPKGDDKATMVTQASAKRPGTTPPVEPDLKKIKQEPRDESSGTVGEAKPAPKRPRSKGLLKFYFEGESATASQQ